MPINRVVITGHLIHDPDLRATATGTPVLGIGLVVNDRRKNQQTGEWEDSPNFIDCTMFGARAEAVSKYLSKGNKVAIEGELRWSQWERDGQKHSKIEVIIDEIEFMSRGDHPAVQQPNEYVPQHQTAPQQPVQSAMPAMSAPVVNVSVYDTDIPF